MVSLINISNTIGEIADLYTCCRSNKINPNSFYKPINNSSKTQLSIKDFYDANDGFNLYTFNTPQQMLYELQHPNASDIWKYSSRGAPFRLTDFENYNHYAPAICNLTYITDNCGTTGSPLRLECNGLTDMIRRWKYFEGVRNYVDFIFLIYPYGTEFDQSGMQGVYAYKYMSMVDYDGDDVFRLNIPSELSAGNYEIRLCCANTYSTLSDNECRYVNIDNQLPGTWYALPAYCKQVLTVQSGGSGGGGGSTSTDYFNYLEIDFYGATYNWNDSTRELSNISFTNYIVINNSSNLTFDLHATYWYDLEPTHTNSVKLMEVRRILNEEDIPYANIRVTYNDPINIIGDPNLDDRIAIRAEITLTVNNGSSQHKSITTTIQKG